VKNFIIISLTLALCGCAIFNTVVSSPVTNDSASSDVPFDSSVVFPLSTDGLSCISLPKQDALVIYGVSSPQVKRETEIENARADAAKKISMYHGVRASYQFIQEIGLGFWDYYVDSNTALKYDTEFEKYQEKLAFDPKRDVLRIDGAVFVRFTYPAVFPGAPNYSSAKGKNGRPAWISDRPQKIGDLYFGVGYAGRQSWMRDAITKSYESALAAIASKISTDIVTSHTDQAGLDSRNTIYSKSEAALVHCLVLEFWVDPETLGVYTLAVARESN